MEMKSHGSFGKRCVIFQSPSTIVAMACMMMSETHITELSISESDMTESTSELTRSLSLQVVPCTMSIINAHLDKSNCHFLKSKSINSAGGSLRCDLNRNTLSGARNHQILQKSITLWAGVNLT